MIDNHISIKMHEAATTITDVETARDSPVLNIEFRLFDNDLKQLCEYKSLSNERRSMFKS